MCWGCKQAPSISSQLLMCKKCQRFFTEMQIPVPPPKDSKSVDLGLGLGICNLDSAVSCRCSMDHTLRNWPHMTLKAFSNPDIPGFLLSFWWKRPVYWGGTGVRQEKSLLCKM